MEVVRRTRLPAALATIAVVGAIALARPAGLHAGDPPWTPPPCPQDAASAPPPAMGTWFSMDPVLNPSGVLAGQRLSLGDASGAARRLDLPAESFASGPEGGHVLVGDDDGSRSRLRLVDVAAGCAADLGQEASVIRSAILSRDGLTSWEHRVNRTTRRDEGIWRRAVAAGPAQLVLSAPASDARFGTTWTTTLDWADDGRLAVASCGASACRVRLLDPSTGRVETVAGTGALIGVAAGRVIAYDTCTGLPCPILAVDIASGRRTTLADAWGSAALGGDQGRTLAYESDRGLAALDAGTGAPIAVPDAGDSSPVFGGSAATSGVELPAGSLLLAPRGHLGRVAPGRRLDLTTDTIVRLPEIQP